MVFLIGMPAAGKTYWGERLAEEFGWEFVDLDEFIAEKEKASIQALFAMYGEAGFREREHKCLKQVIYKHTEPTVIACGGGTPCFFDNLALMNAAGNVVYIQVEVKTLVERLAASAVARPLLRGRGDMEAYLNELLMKRRSFYEQAHFTFSGEEISIDNFTKIMK